MLIYIIYKIILNNSDLQIVYQYKHRHILQGSISYLRVEIPDII